MAPLSEWLELMLAEIARRQEEAQLNAEEEARRVRDAPAATSASDATSAIQGIGHTTTTTETSQAAESMAPSERRRRRG
jgi:hypothetical protein